VTVADVIADGLARAGALRVFAAAGADDRMIAACGRRGLAVVRAGRASSACVMGAVSGALTGTPGVAAIGGDAIDVADGLAHAFRDRLPLVVISASAAAPGPDVAGVTKATLAIGPDSAAHWIAHACRLAMTEPWGPVLLALPAGVAAAAALPVATTCRPTPLPPPDPRALDAAASRLGDAERPVVVVGPLVRTEGDGTWVRAFAEARPAPILVTRAARGVVPDPHPLVIGVLGAGAAERELLESADLIVGVGLDPDDARAHPWPRRTPLLHFTPVVPLDLPADDRPTMAVAGDIGLILEELAPRLRNRRLAEWDVARLHALKQAAAAPPSAAASLAAYRVVEAARRLTPVGTIAVFGAIDRLAYAARAWQAVGPGECWLSSRGSGEGFAVPVAVAAQLAQPARRVLCVTTAAALEAARDEVETVVSLGLPVLIVILGEPSFPPLVPPPGLRSLAAASLAAIGDALTSALVAGIPGLIDARWHGPEEEG
jgi:acetolactate synthase-1/2/3 large subunit